MLCLFLNNELKIIQHIFSSYFNEDDSFINGKSNPIGLLHKLYVFYCLDLNNT